MWIPAGFKVQNPSKNVEDGIIIEDVSHVNTKGSTFIWVPVGDIITNKGTKNIALNRYTFDNATGVPTGRGTTAISGATESSATNFIASTEKYGGYYISQYEARDGEVSGNRGSGTADTNQVVSIKEKPVYNLISRDQAKIQSEAMYNDTNFESELINSYAWDTTLVYIQECSDNSKYSLEYSVNSKEDGISQNGTSDSICNIYDMASNCFELTTESSGSSGNAIGRGGSYQYSTMDNASSRNTYSPSSEYEYASFRPILYLN